MAFRIYSKDGQLRTTFSPTEGSTQQEQLQGSDHISLSCTHPACVPLEVNDYADFCGRRYTVAERYVPRQKSSHEWSYSLSLYTAASLIGRYLAQSDHEVVFSLTAPAAEHVRMIVASINAATGTNDWKAGSVVSTANLTVDYEGTYCDSALEKVANAADTEWWIEGTTVNLCRCEHGEPVELAYRAGLISLEQGQASNVKFFTRLYPIGSSRNIDPSDYGSSRLMLPGRVSCVERDTDIYGCIDHYEKDAFAHIYPRRTGHVTAVRTEERKSDGETYTAYYFSDSSLNFDPNDYILPTKVMRLSFQEGSELAGMGSEDGNDYYFEVNFDGDKQEFEIIPIRQEGIEGMLPGTPFVPKVGDPYILWNIRMPQEYISAAEQELAEAVESFMDENRKDLAIYKARTDFVEISRRNISLSIGQRVTLVSPEFFPATGQRDSRVLKITRRLNRPTDMEIEMGDMLSRSSLSVINDNVEAAIRYVKEGAASLPDLIRTGDRTLPTDNNIFSARRSVREFLSKADDDTAAGLIRFLKGLIAEELSRFKGGAEFGEFISGMMIGTGAAIDPRGNAEFQSVTSRTSFRALEYIVNRLEAQEGDTIFAESDTIECITEESDGTFSLKLSEKYDGYFTAITEGMVIKGTINTLASGGGDFYTSWMRVNSVNAPANTIEVSLYPDDETPEGRNFPPCELMRIVRWGHQTDESKQSLFYMSSTEGRIVKLFRVTKPIIDISNYEIAMGTLPEALSEYVPVESGDSGLYVKNLLYERLLHVDHLGKPLPVIRDRGPWITDGGFFAGDALREETGDYEQSDVWLHGCRWRCMITGTTEMPSYKSPAWAFIEGNPDFTVEFEPVNTVSRASAIDMTLTIVAKLHNQVITDDILDTDIVWTRYSEDADGNPRPTSDNLWAMDHANAGKSIRITPADIDHTGGALPKVVRFTATVTLRDGIDATAVLSTFEI